MGNSPQTQGLYPSYSGVVVDLESANKTLARNAAKNSVSPLLSKRNSAISQGLFAQQLDSCEKSREMFVDAEFPAKNASISSSLEKFLPGLSLKTVIWRRSAEIFSGKCEVFREKVEPGDISQGFLGDCYFLGSLAAVAEEPKRVFQLFPAESRKTNAFGCYCVNLCVDGEWTQVIVDDFFATLQENSQENSTNYSNSLLFSRANGPELWVMLLEKAYAKVFGSYEKIETGFCEQALRELTGAPCSKLSSISSLSAEKVFEFLAKSKEKGYILVAGSDFDAKQQPSGLVASHCYTVLSARKLENPQETLIKLRNPWGHKEWTGDWSDNSEKWTPDARKTLEFCEKDDGVFWMSCKDFCAYFNEIVVCRVRDHCRYFSKKFALEKGKGFCVFAVKIKKNMQFNGEPALEFAVSQRDLRRTQGISKEYAYLRMLFCEFSGKAVRLLRENSGVSRDLQLEVSEQLQENAAYVLYLEADLTKLVKDPSFSKETFILSAYSSYNIEFSELSVESQVFFESLFTNYELNCLETEKIAITYGESVKIRRVFLRISDFLGFGYYNETKDVVLRENLFFEESHNLSTLKNEQVEKTLAVSSNPSSVSWVFLKTRLEFRDSFAKIRVSAKSSLAWTGEVAEIEALAQTQAIKTFQRKLKEQVLNVFVRVYYKFGVLCFLYSNESGKNYKEVASFLTKNLKAVGFEEKSVRIELKNSEKRLLFFEVVDQSKEVYYKLTYVPIIY